MRRIREVLRLRAELGSNLSAISAGAKLARSTVRAYLDRATAAGLDAVAADGLSETALEAALYPPSSATDGRTLPDWAEVDQEPRRHKHDHPQAALDGVQGSGSGRFGVQPVQTAAERMAEGLRGAACRCARCTTPARRFRSTTPATRSWWWTMGTSRAAQIFVACLPCSGADLRRGQLRHRRRKTGLARMSVCLPSWTAYWAKVALRQSGGLASPTASADDPVHQRQL